MNGRPIGSYGLYHALKAEGYDLPDETAHVELLMPVDGIIQLVLTVNMTTETLPKLGRALVRLSEEKTSGLPAFSQIAMAIMCEHANEVPATCPCPADCYCRTTTCKWRTER